VTFADEGELLVCRNLSIQREEDNEWLHHNIFHTRCSSHGKVCDVIIDGGSFENVVSSNLVEKLQLKIEDHPQLYKLSSLDKKKEVKVSKCCLVQFSIGEKYKDEIMCDIVPMDTWHLLLGRPWQYDRRTLHDGYKNTYTFVKDGVKVVLGPSKMVGFPKPSKEEGNRLISKSEIIREVKNFEGSFILVLLEENDTKKEHPSIVYIILFSCISIYFIEKP